MPSASMTPRHASTASPAPMVSSTALSRPGNLDSPSSLCHHTPAEPSVTTIHEAISCGGQPWLYGASRYSAHAAVLHLMPRQPSYSVHERPLAGSTIVLGLLSI